MKVLRSAGIVRSCVIATVILIHAVLLYEATHARARPALDDPPMFGPAIAKKPVPEQAHLELRPWASSAAEPSTYRVQEWHFARTDIWPVTGEACPTPSEFGPFIGTQAETDEGPTPTNRAVSKTIPTAQKPRMVLWLRPAYPLEWARTELEGTVELTFRIPPTGHTDGIEIERSSGSSRLDSVAAEAAKAWQFTPELWKGQPVESKATLELTFRFFEFRSSKIDEDAIAPGPRRTPRRTGSSDRHELIRNLLEQLRTGSGNVIAAPAQAAGEPTWPASMRDWSPISGIQYLGTIGSPEWNRYRIKSQYRTDMRSDSVLGRWEVYRVIHHEHSALWEALLDRKGGVWALKAEALDAAENAKKSAAACLGGNVTASLR